MWSIILPFVISIIIMIILYKLKSKIFVIGFVLKIFSTLFIIAMIASVVFGYYLIKDASEFKDKFATSSSAFVLKEGFDGKAHMITGSAINPKTGSFENLDNEKLQSIEKDYNKEEMNASRYGYYKIIVVDIKSFDNKQYNISDRNFDITSGDAKAILMSPNPRETLADIIAAKQKTDKAKILKDLTLDDSQLKAFVFSYHLSTMFSPDDQTFFLSEIKEGNIRIYEETLMFKAIKIIPKGMYNDVKDIISKYKK